MFTLRFIQYFNPYIVKMKELYTYIWLFLAKYKELSSGVFLLNQSKKSISFNIFQNISKN
ncbi:hypothetical protein DVF89_25530 [Salmonella enterica subsp. enterica]|nr:hypothetical protein [Salmonella enterica subsp. enterica serovar Kinondoni]